MQPSLPTSDQKKPSWGHPSFFRPAQRKPTLGYASFFSDFVKKPTFYVCLFSSLSSLCGAQNYTSRSPPGEPFLAPGEGSGREGGSRFLRRKDGTLPHSPPNLTLFFFFERRAALVPLFGRRGSGPCGMFFFFGGRKCQYLFCGRLSVSPCLDRPHRTAPKSRLLFACVCRTRWTREIFLSHDAHRVSSHSLVTGMN